MQISSKGKRLLIFSDVHQDIDRVKRIIKHEGADYNICLGDWFDSHVYDSKEDAEKTAKYLKNWIFDPKNITCLGNHDLPMFYINKYTYCSGYSENKNNLVDEIFEHKKWDILGKFRWYLWIDDFFACHAGINPVHIHPKIDVTDKNAFSHWLDDQIKQAQVCLNTGQPNWLYGAGHGRGGNQYAGGLTWQDLSQEFEPIEGLPMLFGHTCQKDGKIKKIDFQTYSVNPDKWTNYCIDTMLNEYIVITNGKLEIKNYADI